MWSTVSFRTPCTNNRVGRRSLTAPLRYVCATIVHYLRLLVYADGVSPSVRWAVVASVVAVVYVLQFILST